MLVIRRKAGEALLIGDEIEIEILDITPSRVKLGIRLPTHIAVIRKEARLARQQNIEAAAGLTAESIGALASRLRPDPKPE